MARLARDVGQRSARIEAEVARLGADHPWAGKYTSDAAVGVTVWVAPDSGCVATWVVESRICDANWGSVERVGDKLRISFDQRIPPESLLEPEYTLAVDGAVHRLLPRHYPEFNTLSR